MFKKKLLKKFAFSQKSEANLPSTNWSIEVVLVEFFYYKVDELQ